MMELVTLGGLRAEQLVWRPAHGGVVLTVVCKATFALRPGVSPLAPVQQAVAAADVYSEDRGALLVASELVPLKKQPEVILTGQAYAPEGKRVSSFLARLAVAEIDKAVQVTGDRVFGLDGQLSEAAPFVRMPLVWQRAAGGADTSNPVGRAIGGAAQADVYGRVLAPNLLPAGFHLASRSDVVPVVGLGPIAPLWPSRARCLHRHVAGWDPARWHERALPADIDLAYFNAAPADQRRAAPFGEEQILLENLHPLFGQLSTRLAPFTPTATVERGQGSEVLQLRCDTLLIDSDRGLAMLVWRGHVVLERPDQPGRIVVTHAGAGEAKVSSRPASPALFDHTQAAGFQEQASSTLPFSDVAGGGAGGASAGAGSAASVGGAGVGAAISAGAGAEPAENALLSGATMAVDAMFGSTMAFGFANAAPAVPFAPSGDAPPPREAPPGDGGVGLPFLPAGSVAAPSAPPPSVPPPAVPPPPTAFLGSPPLEVHPPPTAPLLVTAPEVTPAPTGSLLVPPFEVTPPASLLAGSPVADPAPAAPPLADVPAPPAMLGSTAPSADAPGEPVAPGPAADIEVYPPARCGAIAARVECNESTVADILRAEDLDAERWERVHEHWQDQIDAEAARGRTELRNEYDSAYVAALEAERLPITVEVYARLAEAGERGALDETLAELRFPEDAWLHIQRCWIPRMIADPKLGKQVRAAIAAARAAG